MRLTIPAAAALTASLLWPATAGAQRSEPSQPPDFSGRWVVDSQVNSDASPALGDEMTIEQDFLTLAIIRPWSLRIVPMAGTPGQPRDVDNLTYETVYRLDGEPIRDRRPATATPIGHQGTPRVQGWRRIGASEGVSRATWAGDQLVVIQHTTTRLTTDGREPLEWIRTRTVRLSLAYAGDRLVVDVVSIENPDPRSEERQAAPVVTRTIYRRGDTSGG